MSLFLGYHSYMIDRYSRSEMKNIWTLQAKFEYYLQVELAVCEAYAKLGEIPLSDLEEIKQKAAFNLKRIEEIENDVHHDVIAFLTNVNENLGEKLAKYIHKGLTSSDIIDTAFALQIQASGKIIKQDLELLISALYKLMQDNKNTICIGRSHGVHAEIMTFGLKVCSWIDAFVRVKKHFEYALQEAQIGQISGPVGTYSNISPKIEQYTCEMLNLKPARISTQIIARDIHAYFMQSLAMIASIIEQFATEIRHLQRTEVLEVEEGFGEKQKGSSAMPHKKNPVSCENLCGLARVVRANSSAAMENIALWHERDISHSSVERIIFPDSFTLVDYMLNRFKNVVENLQINKKNMLKNTTLYGGIIYSQKVLLKLVDKGLTREEAYEIVQKNALNALENNGDFKLNLKNDKNVTDNLSEKELEECFNQNTYLENIEEIYKRF